MRGIMSILVLIGIGFMVYQNINLQKAVTEMEAKIPESIQIVNIPVTAKGINKEIAKCLSNAEIALKENDLTKAKEEISKAKILANQNISNNEKNKSKDSNKYLEQAKDLLMGLIENEDKKQ